MKIGLFGLMFLIMFALKLAGPMAAISWWVVTLPLWLPAVIAAAGAVAAFAVMVAMR